MSDEKTPKPPPQGVGRDVWATMVNLGEDSLPQVPERASETNETVGSDSSSSEEQLPIVGEDVVFGWDGGTIDPAPTNPAPAPTVAQGAGDEELPELDPPPVQSSPSNPVSQTSTDGPPIEVVLAAALNPYATDLNFTDQTVAEITGISNDDDDDFSDDWERPPGWSTRIGIAAILVLIIGGGGAYWAFSGSSPHSNSPAPVTSACPTGYSEQAFQIRDMKRVCVGPAQYPTDATNSAYSYFSGEVLYGNQDFQLVTTGDPLNGKSFVAPVDPSITTVDSHGSIAANVDLYDVKTQSPNYATSGSVTLSPNGSVDFHDVVVKLQGSPITINGTMTSVAKKN